MKSWMNGLTPSVARRAERQSDSNPSQAPPRITFTPMASEVGLCSYNDLPGHGTKGPCTASHASSGGFVGDQSESSFGNSRRSDAIKSLLTNCRHVRKLIMARRDFGGDAKTRPVIHTIAKVCG